MHTRTFHSPATEDARERNLGFAGARDIFDAVRIHRHPGHPLRGVERLVDPTGRVGHAATAGKACGVAGGLLR